jgi:tRNA (guanine37-N1)-methyltransferase
MTFHIITLFPEMFEGVFSQSILSRARKEGQIAINFINPRDFCEKKYQSVDDKPYGGGAGMIMRVDILIRALESISAAVKDDPDIKPKPYSILLAASGKKYNQKIANTLKTKKQIAIICGRYEGVDARVEKYVDEVISIGDFVLTGGEIPAMVIIDSVTRLIPGVINPKSLESESFSQSINNQQSTINNLEYPQYTRPEEFRGRKVPKILLSGNHAEIAKWRKSKSQKISKK